MDENRIEGTARNLAGKVQGAVGDLTGDTKSQVEGGAKELAGQAQQVLGEAKDKAGDVASSVSEQIAQLRAQVEALLKDNVAPALANAAGAAGGYAREARAVVQGQAQHAATAIKDRPLVALTAVAVLGFLIGSVAAASRDRYRG